MKGMLAVELTLFLHFARQAQVSDQRLDRDLPLLSVADEEVGAKGAPGHASIPHGDSAIARLARALTRITSAPLPMHVLPTSRRLIQLLAATQSQPRRSLLLQIMNPLLSERVLALLPDQDTANALRAMLHSTASPTLLQAGTALNVIPGEATAAASS